jgi:Helicase conserved C-terminal domain
MTDVTIERPDTEKELAYLKDFQRLSVDTVFRRMYLDTKPTRRFLVADEVGLGKTLVARGVIARTIDHLWDTVQRIDIVYLCSNSNIARQNVRRLTPTGISGVSIASRITLLPLETHAFKERKVNVIALTPGTSLSLKGNLGLMLERGLLLKILAAHWNLDRTGASRLFAGNASLQRFRAFVRDCKEYRAIDPDLRQSFVDALDAHCDDAAGKAVKTIRQSVESLVAEFKSDATPSREVILERSRTIGELRQVLARSCIRALQPDLIVLDEFQRFKELLDGEGEAGEMARHLFEYKDSSTETRVLLLSATPYKMYTVQDDAGNEDHYADFLRTARFLFADDAEATVRLGELLQKFREQLFRLGQDGTSDLISIRDAIEVSLRSVMVRTERLALTPDRSGMLVEKDVGNITIQPRDASNYASVQTLARLVDSPDTMEFWKAAPWLLNFMEQYKLSSGIDALIEEPSQSRAFVKAISAVPVSLMSFDDVTSFRRLDPAHARLRWLIEHVLDGGLWKLLWLPPTLPYYQLGTPFSDLCVQSPTKTLLFSAWRVVPRVVAAILSHEAERRMYVGSEGETADLTGAPDRLGDLLKISRKEGRAAGLTVLSLMYPCSWLAQTCDPIEMAASFVNERGRIPTLDELLEEAERRIAPSLERITPPTPDRSTPDESWYWAASILLDRANGSVSAEWFDRELAALWAAMENPVSAVPADELDEEGDSLSAGQDAGDSDSAAINDLVERVRQTAKGELPRGVPPKDLVRTLALAAVANPATVSLRAFSRVAGVSALNSAIARDAAARVGAGFRTLFNQPDSTAAVRATGTDGQDYWKQCLEYCAHGCLQSLLDEYVHLLVGEAGVFGKSPDEIVTAVAGYVSDVVGLRRARVGAQNIVVADGKVTTKSAAFRSRFAMRFGEERADEAGDKVRADEVRKAFNSPFWPFVLATTSVGQEGLDFHQYCHRVVHWNLPPNPVDLEQREGRVHRFKGHAVRKNVAQRHAKVWYGIQSGDRWEETFAEAKRGRLATENDLVPYWVYTAPNGATIERYVPCYPLSRDIERFKSLKDSLVLYRMVFGQPRQEELLSYLARVVAPEKIPLLAEQLKISLAPRADG